jgi:hypothetical protein
MTTSLTLIDCSLEPTMIYNILDALYSDSYNEPLDNLDIINYLEGRLMDADLPLDRTIYEEQLVSVDYQTWREFNIFESDCAIEDCDE